MPGIFAPKSLHDAAVRGKLDACIKFVELQVQGADVNEVTQDRFAVTPLMKGIHHLEIVKYLHGKGADLNIRDSQGQTAQSRTNCAEESKPQTQCQEMPGCYSVSARKWR